MLGKRKRIATIVRHIILLLGAVVFAFPLYWLVTTSFKTDTNILKVPPQMFPNPVTIENYIKMWKYFPFMRFLGNTLQIVLLNLAGVLITAPLVAYSFSRLQWAGRNAVFAVMIGTMMLPSQVTMIPIYVTFSRLRWIDTYFPLWVPAWFGGSALFIFLLRQFMLTIPAELEESALIDGANHLVIYGRVILPLVLPSLMTISIFTFMNTWNDFMGPLIYLNTPEKSTLSLGLRLFQQTGGIEFGMLMAAATLMTLPVILFFFIGQKSFIEGVVLTGMKA